MFKKGIIVLMCLFMIFAFSFSENTIDTSAEDEVEETLTILDEDGVPFTVDINMEDTGDDEEEETSSSRSSLASASSAQFVRFKTYASIGGTVSYTEVLTGNTGYFNSNYGTDAAYIKTSGSYVYCKMSGVVMKVSTSYVSSISTYSSSSTISYYTVNSSGWLVHYYTYRNSSNTVTLASTRVGYAPSYLSTGTKYYSYDGHYFYTTYAKMITDYTNYSSLDFSNSVNEDDPYYNYYQYLSLRSETTFTTSNMNSRISSVKGSSSILYNNCSIFTSAQDTYGINAAIMFGIACNESAYGTSSIATNKNNLFGLNAYDSSTSSASTFSSLQTCVNEFANYWMSQGYLNGTDSRYRGPHLGDKESGINVKYASDPYWGEKAASQCYYLSGVSSDCNYYTLGIVQDSIITTYQSTNTNTKIYTSGTASDKVIYNYPTIILEKTSSTWYKIQSDMPLKSDRSARNLSNTYDFDRDYVYTKAANFDFIITGTKSTSSSSSSSSSTVKISSCTIGSVSNQTYTGSAIKPSVKITYNGTTLTSGTDYTLSYKNNTSVGTATITITGKGNYTGTATTTFKITARSISSATIGSVASKTYTGSAIKPSLTITYNSKTLTSGTDYSLSYKNNTNVGTATITITGKGNYSGTTTKTFKITQRSISSATVASISKQAYTGSAIKPSPKITYNGKTLTKGTDYTLSYKNNTKVGTATITITGKGNFKGTITKTFTIYKKVTFTVSSISNKTYTGSSIKPSVTVKVGSKKLTKGTDYTVTYSNNKSPGKATIKITGKGTYAGNSKTIYFYITPKKVSWNSLKGYNTYLKLNYKKCTGASGYRVAYRKKGSSTWTYIYTTSLTPKITGLKRKTTYQVKVNAYKTVSGKRYYGPVSWTLDVKTK